MSLFTSSLKRMALLALGITINLLIINSWTLALAEPPDRAADGDKIESRLSDAEVFLSNNLLRIYISERASNLWEYQYSPGSWGESNYHELFALYTPAGGIVESPNLTIEQPFANPGGGPGAVTAVLSNNQFTIKREVTLPPNDARYLRIDYDITNKTGGTIQDVRFFQAIDFDIPWTGDHIDDYGWYDATTDYIGVRDEQFFRNVLASVPHSDNHSVDFYFTQIYLDWDDGNLAGKDAFGPGDPAVAKQFNFGNLAPNQSKHVSFYVWFGDPTSSVTCVKGRVTQPSGAGLSDATVKATNQATLASFSTQTDAAGNYQLDGLEPGSYSINISKPDYKPFISGFSLDEDCIEVSPRLQRAESDELTALAQDNAPDIYQDTDGATNRGDFFTRADYDGNWNGLDNWQNLFSSSQPAYVYWGVASSISHHFLKYYLFYPRDWGEVPSLLPSWTCTTDGEGQENSACHENDLEGFAIAVNRLTNDVDYMVIRQHGLPPIPCIKNYLTNAEPTNVIAQTKGHATFCLYNDDTHTFPNGNGVIYRYGNTAETPSSITDREVFYDLIHVDELWAIVGTAEGAQAYTSNRENFRGNDWGNDKASTPWALNFTPLAPSNRGSAGAMSDTYQGDLYADPARLFASLFPDGDISTEYTFNPYLTALTNYQPEFGGWAATPAGDVAVFLPFGAIDEVSTVVLSYDVIDNLPTRVMNRSSVPVAMIGRPFVLSANRTAGGAVTVFDVPARLEVSYSQSYLETLEVSTQKLQIAQWDGSTWLLLPTEVDEARGIALAHVENPGTFALFVGDPNTQSNGPIFLPAVLYSEIQHPIDNGNFETGPTGWNEFSSNGWPLILNDFAGNEIEAHSGMWAAWLGGDFDEHSILSQQIMVSASQKLLRYYYFIYSEDACGYDFAGIYVNGHSVAGYDLCADTMSEPYTWEEGVADLSDYVGQSVLLEFVVTTDYSLISNWFIDDVSFASSRNTVASDVARPHTSRPLGLPKNK